MTSSREKFFKDRVLQALYQDDEESSDEEIKKKSPKHLNEQEKAAKRKYLSDHKSTKTEDKDWPVPLPKLKKVYTVTVRPEDLQGTPKSQGKSTNASNPQTEDAGPSSNAEQKISKNKKRKLKKKRQKEKERNKRRESPLSREFTY